jgi:hypothetical protein
MSAIEETLRLHLTPDSWPFQRWLPPNETIPSDNDFRAVAIGEFCYLAEMLRTLGAVQDDCLAWLVTIENRVQALEAERETTPSPEGDGAVVL